MVECLWSRRGSAFWLEALGYVPKCHHLLIKDHNIGICCFQPSAVGIGVFAPQSPRISSPARNDSGSSGNFGGGGGRGRGKDQRDASIIGL